MPATTVALVRPRPSARLLAAATTLLALAVVLAVGLVAGALPASAHDALLSSVPADGQTVEQAPESILLTFTEAPLETGAQIVVAGPDGAQVEVGELAFDAAAAGVKAALPTDVAGGTYTVAWHVVSSDGHPIEGTLSYTVPEPATEATTEATATPTPSSEGDAVQADTSVEGDDLTAPVPTGDASTPLVIAGSIAAAAVVAAAAFFAVRRKIQDNEELRRNKPSEPSEPTEPTEQSEPEDPENPKP